MHTITIKHRYTGAVLFEFQATDEQQASGMAVRHALEAAAKSDADLRGANLIDANLSYTDLRGANLIDANLIGANLSYTDLRGANLRGANLIDANLIGAKWRDGIVIQRAPLQLHGLRWSVTILEAHMQIGCELHALAEWQTFDDARIAAMDGRDALRFWRAHKDALLSLARSDGRSFEPVAQQAEAA